MKKTMKVLGVLVVLLAAAAVSVVALVTQYDYNQLKPRIEAMAEQATGRDLTIGGDLDLRVSLQPTLRVADVTFANADWGQGGADMVRLDQLDAKLDLLSLLQGRVDVDYILIDGLDVVLETSADNRANWEFQVQDVDTGADADGADTLAFVPNVRDVRVLDARLTYIDGRTGKSMTFDLNRATVRADGFDAPIHATLAATYQGVEVSAAVDMGSAAHLVGTGAEPFPVTMDVSAPGLSARIEGTVDQPRQGLGLNAHVDVRVSDGATLDALAGVDLPDLSGLSARFAVAGEGAAYRLSAIDVRVAGSDLAGDVLVNITGARPKVSGKISSKVLDLDALLDLEVRKPASGGAALPTEKPAGDAPKLFSRDPLALDGLKAADADLEVFAGQVTVSGMTVNAGKARVRLAGGDLRLDDYAFTLEGGDVAGMARLNTGQATPALDVAARVRTLDVGRVLDAWGKRDSKLTLPLSGEVNLDSRGNSPHLLMRNMNGRARFAAENGRFDDSALQGVTAAVGSILPWAEKVDGSVINCVIADWPIKNGIATAETMVMDTPGLAVAVTGNVDLGGEILHLTVLPQAKQTSLASFAVPVRVKGAFTQPYVDVDPGDLVVGTVGNIVKAPGALLSDILGGVLPGGAKPTGANPYLQGAGGAQQPAQPAPAGDGQPAPPPATKPSGANNPVDALGNAIDGLLGR